MWWILPLAVACGAVLLDQVSKILVLNLMYQGQVVLIPNILNFTYVENRGMAFGWLSDHRWVFLLFSVLGIAAMTFYLWKFATTRVARIGLALMIGGGIGNMIDRLAYGFVVDFIDFCAFDFWQWVFNVADACVCVGAALLALDIFRELFFSKENPPAKEDGDGTNS